MRLLLSMLGWPDGTKPEVREIDDELAIGRGRESGWMLPDPASQLSRRHCLLTPFGDGWRVTDLSLNGTFVNDSLAPLGRQQMHELHDGDRIRLGSYVIEARYQAPPSLRAPVADRSPFEAGPAHMPGADWQPNGWGSTPRPFAGDFGAGFEPPGKASPDDFVGQPSADHTPAVSDAWQTPPPSRVVIPDDWDLEDVSPPKAAPALSVPPVGRAGAPVFGAPGAAPPAASFAVPAVTPFAAPPAAPPAASAGVPFVAPTTTPPPAAEWTLDDLEPIGPAAALPAHPDPAPQPSVHQPAAHQPSVHQPAVHQPAVHQAAVRQAAEPRPALQQPVAGVPSHGAGDAALLAAFLRGAGLGEIGGTDPVAMMESVGAVLRTMVDRMREIQADRGSIKREFRILATMVNPEDNNPIKFSASNEAALRSLLTGKRPADRAVGEVLDEIRLHEVAMIAAMRDAVSGLLQELNPAPLLAAGHAFLPGQRKAKAFEQYEALHARVVQALTDDFDSVFGKAFARAYERVALDEDKPSARTRK